MPRHDFTALFDVYPVVIAEMPAVFTSHDFILKIARQYQKLYIDALYTYRDRPAPFMTVHSILAKGLSYRPDLVEPLGRVASKHLLGLPSQCEQWRKRQHVQRWDKD
jgi:hypothetical protein